MSSWCQILVFLLLGSPDFPQNLVPFVKPVLGIIVLEGRFSAFQHIFRALRSIIISLLTVIIHSIHLNNRCGAHQQFNHEDFIESLEHPYEHIKAASQYMNPSDKFRSFSNYWRTTNTFWSDQMDNFDLANIYQLGWNTSLISDRWLGIVNNAVTVRSRLMLQDLHEFSDQM